MTITEALRHTHRDLWQRMITHPFVLELGEGTLPVDTFRAYFLQDYVFVRDLVTLTALGIAKAPSMAAAGTLNQFLSGILQPENDLFVRAFTALGVAEVEYAAASAAPLTQAFGDFLVRTGAEGNFADIAMLLYVTEGTYLDWGTQLLAAGKRPDNPLYQEWITIHGPQVLGPLVAWLGGYLDANAGESQRPRLERLFHTTLRYEYLFWDMAYHGRLRWPDQ
jgi:thiaminase/transcriptional activator TenA